ncbi:DUF2799 domain-containing protein [Shewanella profunda]|uniref:DUF2799 domain-containing protein n=1 Tax=Shewanella profunda TaxID=254793 RepID=UPI00200C3FA6|nr:DUF2799 domain-containing protein [Shewanella profunda]MCL1090702.1 DUF2799 domain-containing protein [Shewanella profunda]
MRYLNLASALGALCLTQCTSLSLEECSSSDWYTLGLADGNRGATAARLNQYQKDCHEFNLKVDSSQWQQGYQQGLINYCLPENGYRVGLEGESYYGVCSDNQFVERYNQGHQQYLVNKRLAEIADRLNAIDSEISSINNTLNSLTDKAELLKQKNTLLNEKSHLLDERSRLHQGNMRFKFKF